MVLQVEDLREAGAGKPGLVPGAVPVLGAEEVVQAAEDVLAGDVAGGDQAHQRPGGLGGGARPLAAQAGIVVGRAGLAPAAVLILRRAEPLRRFLQVWLPNVFADTRQALEDLLGAVDVVHAPAPEPGPIRLLLLL